MRGIVAVLEAMIRSDYIVPRLALRELIQQHIVMHRLAIDFAQFMKHLRTEDVKTLDTGYAVPNAKSAGEDRHSAAHIQDRCGPRACPH